MKDQNPFFRVTIDLAKVGKWLRQGREDMHLSVRDVAKLCGMSATQVTRMESGEDFTMGMLVRFAVPLGIPPASLIDGALSVERNTGDPGARTAYEALYELDSLEKIALSKGYAITSFGLMDLMDLVGVCACQLLLSANPRETLQNLAIPLPSLRRRLEGFIDAYGLETESSERAVVFRALITRPARKLRALGLLAEEVVDEFLKLETTGKEILSSNLKISQDQIESEAVSDTSSAWSQLVSRTIQVTGRWGAKTQLARDLGVTPQAVNQWLSGASAPSAETTLRLLRWVTAKEAEQK